MSLSELIKDNQTACFNQYGVFFAFSNKQLNEQKKPDVEYVSLGSGTICPKNNVKAFIEAHAAIVDAGIVKDVDLHGKEAIIRRELDNHECYYTGDPEDCIEALKDYPITAEEIRELFFGR